MDTEEEQDQDQGEDHILIKNATLIVLDAPSNMEFGIDLQSWNIKNKNKYMGIKFIPPGFRFVHYRIEDQHGGPSFRIGFIHYFENGEFMVRSWDNSKNEMSADPVPDTWQMDLQNRVFELEKILIPYSFDYIERWKKLTDKIDFDVIKRCRPLCGFIYSALELVPSSVDDNSEHSTEGENLEQKGTTEHSVSKKTLETECNETKIFSLLPQLIPKPGSELRLTKLPDKYHPDDATPYEITKQNLDYSYAWERVVNTMSCPGEIIGELQLTFVCVLIGQNWEAFTQWKKIVSLMCGIDTVIPSYKYILAEFLWTIEIQLDYIPEDMLVDVIYTENFIYHNLRKLFRNVESHPDLDDSFKLNVQLCRQRVSRMCNWDFGNLQEDEGEELPAIVE